MRKVSAILLLLVLLVNSIGPRLFLHIQTLALKKEMKAYLRSNHHPEEEFLSMRKTEEPALIWENANEFSYKGEMYDVLEKKERNGYVEIRCIGDTKETALLDSFKQHARHGNGQKTTTWIKLLQTPFVPVYEEQTGHYITQLDKYSPGQKDLLPTRTNDILKPPVLIQHLVQG